MAGRIFISYRRADAAQPAGWLSDQLTARFGRPQVVRDVDPAAVASCDVLLALIGRRWLTVAGQDPDDSVRLEIESALTRGVRVIPVLVDGARMPRAGDLPPSLAGLAGQPPLELSANRLEPDTARLLQVLDRSIAERQATQAGPVGGQPTVTAQPRPAQPLPAQPSPAQSPPGRTEPMPRRRVRPRTIVLVACGAVAAAVVAFVAVPGSQPAPSSTIKPQHDAMPKTAASPGPAAAPKVIVADGFSTEKVRWVDDFHHAAGAYTGTGAYRLGVTGANGQSELARPSGATHGLGDVTPLNLDVTVDARKVSGAPQGYGYGIALRGNGGGDVYAFLVMDHAVAIQKWVGGGARVTGVPAPVSTSAPHAGAADRLRAVCRTAADGTSVHLELWLNGTKMVDYTDRDHPYTQGYLGLYVETISDASSPAAAEFDNFTASQL